MKNLRCVLWAGKYGKLETRELLPLTEHQNAAENE